MKKLFSIFKNDWLAIFFLFIVVVVLMFIGNRLVESGEPVLYDDLITVSTNTTVVGGYLKYRAYYLIVNTNASNIVYHSTSQINSSNYTTFGANPIPTNFGSWEDTGFIVKSTYYACTLTGTAVVNVRQKE